MKRKWQSFISIVLYIIILTWALDFDILKLIDIRLMLLVLFGTAVLALPFCKRGMQWTEFTYIFGRKAMEAGFIQTFLLLFASLQKASEYDGILGEVAMCFRPVLYGFCLLILLSERTGQEDSGADAGCGREEAAVQNTCSGGHAEQSSCAAGDFGACGLTKRETEIVHLIQQGRSNGEIAAELFISETTVKKHVSNIFEKTGVKRREELRYRS